MANEYEEQVQKVSVTESDDGLTLEGEDSGAVQDEADQIALGDLQAGFDKARGIEEAPADEADELDMLAELESLRAFRTEATEKLDKATKRIQSLDGFKGSIKQQIEQGVRTALENAKASGRSGNAPSGDEIEAAMYDPEALKELMEEYPSFAPMGKALEALSSRIEKIGNSTVQSPTEAKPTAEPDLSELDNAHSDWRQTVVSQDFKTFALSGGPDVGDYEDLAVKFQSGDQSLISEADSTVESWKVNYPEWWASSGSQLFGGIDGSLKMLDKFAASTREDAGQASDKDDRGRQELSSEERRNLSRQKRIRRTVSPETKSGAPATGMNDDEAFSRGFDKVKKHSRT